METKKKIRVFMGVPSMGSRSDAQVYALRDIEETYQDKIQFVYPTRFTQRIFHDYARNMMVEDFLKTDCDAIWFLDSDISPPTSIGTLITSHWDKWVAAGAPYPLFLTPAGHEQPKVVFAVYNDYGKGYNTTDIPQMGIDFVNGIASGCIFIKREVFEKMEKPYFEFTYEADTRKMKMGEDIGFCKKVNAQGHKFFIDYSMLCRHFKTVDLLEVNNYVISEFNARWLEQDRLMRSQIAEIKLGIKSAQTRSKLLLS